MRALHPGASFRVFGPPGTGKTTWLAKTAGEAAREHGVTKVIASSFTRAAAEEIASRNLPLPPENIGTLHSLALRSLGGPDSVKVVEDPAFISTWNSRHPHYEIRSAHDGPMRMSGAVNQNMKAQSDFQRARLIPVDDWPGPLKSFWNLWAAFKAEFEAIDYTDMIEMALTHDLPMQPKVGFFDEAQDFTPLELKLVRKWGEKMEKYYLSGDDDQAIFQFTGATPEAFVHPAVPPEQLQVLSQSYRIPRAVHVMAEKWVAQIPDRQKKDYKSKDEMGSVELSNLSLIQTQPLIDEVMDLIGQGKEVMMVCPFAKPFDNLKMHLRREGIPYWNPYQPGTGTWNPLHPARDAVSARDRVEAYLAIDERLWGDDFRDWTGRDFKRWTECIQSDGVFRRGAKAQIKSLPNGRALDWDEIEEFFVSPEVAEQAAEPSLDWFRENLLASWNRPIMAFAMRIAMRDPWLLRKDPKLILGTIHSVKGGEAHVVYLFPDLGGPQFYDWQRPGEGRDQINRMMYVGMTRPKETLVVCRPQQEKYVTTLRGVAESAIQSLEG